MKTDQSGVASVEQQRLLSKQAPTIHVQNFNPNGKINREATTHVTQDHYLKNLRQKQAFYYDRVPCEKIEQYNSLRATDISREQNMIHNRFPELKDAREAFLGPENQLQKIKQSHAQELVQFSDVVQKLAKEEEPYHSSNLNNDFAQGSPGTSNRRTTAKSQQHRVTQVAEGGLYARGKARSPDGIKVGHQTMSTALKNKYIVRSRHGVLTDNHFKPVNRSEARENVRPDMIHDSGAAPNISHMENEYATAIRESVHGHKSVFNYTNPISQDIFKSHASVTLDKESNFAFYVPPSIKNEKNPRLAALDNFKEISRIMTKNFLDHKKLEKRFEKTVIPKAERDKLKTENEAQQRMIDMLKKMHSPTEFMSPAGFPEGSVDNITRSQLKRQAQPVSRDY